MISSFNITKLTALLKDFYTITDIRITVFDTDFQEIVSYPAERASFCRCIRKDPAACRMCAKCDESACQTASKRHDTYIYQCHAGLTEAIMPIRFSNLIVGYLLFGHIFSYPDYETGWSSISEKCKHNSINLSLLEEACRERPIITEEYILSASHLLSAVATYLSFERMATLKLENLPVQIDQYIQKHLTDDISAVSICEQFQIGKTRLYEIARESYGMGIAEFIRRQRIEKAKKLLTDRPELTIAEVASLCGFRDYNYFITVFTRICGQPPKRFVRSRM